jgi:hypothetical protein
VKSAILLALACFAAYGQDPFEIHVYEYEELKPGQFTLEQHLNYVPEPGNDQFHMTYELTGAITDHISLGFMELNGVRFGKSGLEEAGWRVLPHFYVPESWHLPFRAGLVTEFSFEHPTYSADSRHVEIRPILERRFGSFQVDFNPVASRALHGPGIRDGWHFEPAARVAWFGGAADPDEKRFVPYLESYNDPETHVHQIFPGVDWRLARHLLWSLGIGPGLNSAQPRLVFKSRMEFEFGRRD